MVLLKRVREQVDERMTQAWHTYWKPFMLLIVRARASGSVARVSLAQE